MGQYSQYLESLYEEYSSGSVADVHLSERYKSFQNSISGMAFSEQDPISCAVHLLCAEYEHHAYLDGICAGAKLVFELLLSKR